jgi:poly-gamma-glutamate synthesis protein (capsule biosynthesis protein)
MKKMVIIGVIVLFTLILIFNLRKKPVSSTLQTYPELALDKRPNWAQWRAEGQGIKNFLLHFFSYQEKSSLMALNPFPGQQQFFAGQAQHLKNMPQPPESQPFVRVGFVGDLMEVPLGKQGFISQELLAALHDMDLVLGNLETPISQTGTISKFRNALSQFNVSVDYLNGLLHQGKPVFHFLSLANNHITDRGDLGVQETMNNLENKGILAHGVSQKKFAIYITKGIRFGVSTATWGVNPLLFQKEIIFPIWNLPGIAPLNQSKINLDQLKDALAEMEKEGVDFKILFLHWGYEFETYPDPEIQKIGRELIHAGADLIIGSHSHVLQPFEMVQVGRRQGLIAYSMGNFVSTMTHPFHRIGMLQELKVWKWDKKIQWCLGPSRFTEITLGEIPQTRFIKTKPSRDILDAFNYYAQSLNVVKSS